MSNIKVCLDSRLIKPKEYFIPIKGEKSDGHNYIKAAIDNGAAGVIEESELYKITKEKLDNVCPIIIGVTGSSGKTTVTNFLFQILREKHACCLGSLNTKLGLSVNVINDMPSDCKYFIAEMGMDRAGELTETTSMFPPDISVITTINQVHLEKLGSIEAIADAKAEILYGMKKDGTAVLCKENKYVENIGEKFIIAGGKVIWYSHDTKIEGIEIPKNLLGIHNKRNAVCTAYVCKILGIDYKEINEGLTKLKLPKGRLNIISGINGSTIIDDTYNANPESTKYALEVLQEYKGKRKIAVLGSMLELGNTSEDLHSLIGKQVSELGIDLLVTVGTEARAISNNAKGVTSIHLDNSDNRDDLIKFINPSINDAILVKGSQGLRMEKIVKELMANPNDALTLLVRQDSRWV